MEIQPGRKPATDNPPTKRKAQNRAAQRAFRERRAALVNELENKIKEIEAGHASKQADSHKVIEQLRTKNTQLLKESAVWRVEVEKLKGEKKELAEKMNRYRGEIERLNKEKELNLGTSVNKVQQVASPPSEPEPVHEDIGSKVITSDKQIVETAPLPPRSLRNTGGGIVTPTITPATTTGAGGCRKDSSGMCPCMGNSESSTSQSFSLPIDYTAEVTIHTLLKRPTSPSTKPLDKRARLTPTPPASGSMDELETDFTGMYALGSHTCVSLSPSRSAIITDPCGFCTDGTPCVCAEMDIMKEGERESVDIDVNISFENDPKLPPLQLCETGEITPTRMGTLHPPNGTKPAFISCAERSKATVVCGKSGPGSCATCQEDPLAMLFCQSVAFTKGYADTRGNEGGKSCGRGKIERCCGSERVEPGTKNSIDLRSDEGKCTPMLPPTNSIYIPCSAAYQTLARHKAFEQASMIDFPGLVRPLVISEETEGKGKCPRVEVGSVRDVLKMSDRRFCKDVV